MAEYIERDAVLEAVSFYDEDSIRAIPAADVVPVRHGKWEWNDDNGYYYCSLCKSIAPKEDQDGNYYDWVNYCPNCGAKMMDGDGE